MTVLGVEFISAFAEDRMNYGAVVKPLAPQNGVAEQGFSGGGQAYHIARTHDAAARPCLRG